MSGLPPQLFRNPIDLLELLCKELELTDTQKESAERSYNSVSDWLNDRDSAIARYRPHIHPQGSIALGTTVKPHNRTDFDIDLICLLQVMHEISANDLFHLVYNRLNAHGTYKNMLSRMNRCARLDYEPDYHLDITPAKPHLMGGTHIYVPDRALAVLKDSNPKGYIDWFKGIGRNSPTIRRVIALSNARVENRASVEPLELQQSFEKKPLQRIVQILKRHRDLYFEKTPDIAVISVIITTLTAMSYNRVIGIEFDSMEDFVEAVVRDLPNGLECRQFGGRAQWWLSNPSSPGENFAEKLNADPKKKEAFDKWHAHTLATLDQVLRPDARGLHNFAAANSRLMGENLVNRVMTNHGKRVLSLQESGGLTILTGGSGLTMESSPKTSGMPVRRNTYYGA